MNDLDGGGDDYASWRDSVCRLIQESRKSASWIRHQAQEVRAASVELRMLSQEFRARVKMEADASRVRLNRAEPYSKNLGGKYINNDAD